MATGCTCANLTCCGCCEGITQETPQTIQNRPGLSAIAYRAGTYTQFYQTLLARIAQSRQPSLRQLRSREPDDFTIALLDAFSVMGDVLTFYSERIANESYLGTATETRSVAWLANLVGYRMSPGVAADAFLAFTIDPSAGAYGAVLSTPANAMLAQAFTPAQPASAGAQSMPEQIPSTVIPIGTQVQSIPGPGQTPQTFETVEQINARPEWNAIAPQLVQPQSISANFLSTANAILLSGSVTTLKNGDWLLLVPAGGTPLAPVAVLAVNVASNGQTTEVDLAIANPPPANAPPPIYTPVGFTDDPAAQGTTLPQGSESTLQAAPDISSAAALLAGTSNWWDAGDIVAAATANQWPLDQLGTLVNQLVASQPNAQGSVYAFRQQAAPFGYNAPNYYSLPPSLRIENIFATSSPPNEDIPAAYPIAWDANSSASPPTTEFDLYCWGNGGVLYLDNVYSQIVPGSYIVLLSSVANAEGTFNRATFTVAQNTTVTHKDFTLSAKVSCLTLSGSFGKGQFSLRSTVILCQAEALPLAQVPIMQTNIGGGTSNGVITLGGAYLGLLAGQQAVVSGTTLSQQPSSPPSPPAAGPPAAEVGTLEQVIVTGGFTVITLAAPLNNLYLRSSVSINANVAGATHGQTVSETLGSGDGTQQFQSFVLHQSPLTYVQADTTTGSTSTLQVYVDGVQWTEVPYFYGHGSTEHIFITSQDDNGVTTVTFGDGNTGSRLPTGTANVTARYRFGIGTAGLVNASQLTQLMSRPLGVRSVNNPLPSTGAADPEDLSDGRQNATLDIMTLGRVVSLEDYQDFALSLPGIGKALATWTWDGQMRVVVLTVAGASGPISSSDSILTTLQGAIAACSEPGVTLYLFPYTPLYFNLNATVQIQPSYQVALVQPAIESALRQTFSFAARSFGQPVYLSEVIAAIQDVDGVVDVVATIYSTSDPSQTPQQQIAATIPQTGGRNQIVPAQLLTLDPGQLGLVVTTVPS